MNSLEEGNFRFADFELVASKRLLLRDGVPVALNSKTFDLLAALVERRGEILSKDELLEKIWEGQFVEESNLTVQISTLRKLLGESRGDNKFIVTVPGKGYKFVGGTETDGDLVVENHSYSNIVINQQTGPSRRLVSPRSLVFYGLPAIVLLAAGGYYFLRHRSGALPFVQKQIRQLTTNGKVRTAALSPDDKLFAYVTDDNGQQSLKVARIDGGNEIVVHPPSEASYYSLAFSTDSGSLFFSMRDDANRRPTLYRVPAFGGVQEKLIDNLAYFALSPDSKRIAYTRRNDEEKKDGIFVSTLDGDERQVGSLSIGRFVNFFSLSFSPDGQELAFAAAHDDKDIKGDIFIDDIASGQISQLTHQNFGDVNKTYWLTDGSGLIVSAVETESWAAVPQYKMWNVSTSDGKATPITSDLSSYADGLSVAGDDLLTIEQRQVNNIWVAPAGDLGHPKQVTFGSFGKYDGLWGIDWTPDGRIVFDSSDTDSQVISSIRPDGSDRKQLTVPGQVDAVLTVSGDGHYVVFHSTRGGGFDIWRMEMDTGDLTQLTFGKEEYQPTLSPDGRWVFYKSWERGVGELHRISIDGEDDVALTNSETSWMSASPDGKYLAAVYNTDRQRLAVFTLDGVPVKQFDYPKSATFWGGMRWTPDSRSIVYRDTGSGYWRQSIDGGPPVRMEELPNEKLYLFAWSKDGKQFAFVRGEEIRDVVLFRNLK